MKIVGIEGMSSEQLATELKKGGRFVVYMYCVSVLVMTFRRASAIHFIRAEESLASKGNRYNLLSLLLGWWGLPWGPIFTLGVLATNLGGGKDVTAEVLASFR